MREALHGVGGVECQVLYEDGVDPPVLLLHGYSFRGKTWAEAGVLGALEERGIRYAAPDMPYGRSTSCTKRSRDWRLNTELARAVSERFLRDTRPVIVGASLGGRIALYYAARYGARGLFLASPALREDDPVWGMLRAVRSPAVIIRGARDFVPRTIHDRLAKKLGAELVVYEGAGHAMYLDNPERFIRDLLVFLEKVGGLDLAGRHD
ncbi:MAG: alpha/beta hydrolase [Desulfurococcales archaeon]|nr:alpha/beta hydrolase [Desulfurococcales archaeon]